jgi:hypothetical protein
VIALRDPERDLGVIAAPIPAPARSATV